MSGVRTTEFGTAVKPDSRSHGRESIDGLQHDHDYLLGEDQELCSLVSAVVVPSVRLPLAPCTQSLSVLLRVLNLAARGNGSCSSSSSSYWWRRSGRIPRPCGSVRHGSLCKARKGGQSKLLSPESCGNE